MQRVESESPRQMLLLVDRSDSTIDPIIACSPRRVNRSDAEQPVKPYVDAQNLDRLTIGSSAYRSPSTMYATFFLPS